MYHNKSVISTPSISSFVISDLGKIPTQSNLLDLQILKNALGKQNDTSNFPESFNIDKNVSNRTQIAESFNNYFSRIGVSPIRAKAFQNRVIITNII